MSIAEGVVTICLMPGERVAALNEKGTVALRAIRILECASLHLHRSDITASECLATPSVGQGSAFCGLLHPVISSRGCLSPTLSFSDRGSAFRNGSCHRNRPGASNC